MVHSRGIVLGIAALALLSWVAPARAAEPVDSQLPKYDVTWTSPSTSITGGMPIGNGRIGGESD
jgi:hypothetical protein